MKWRTPTFTTLGRHNRQEVIGLSDFLSDRPRWRTIRHALIDHDRPDIVADTGHIRWRSERIDLYLSLKR